jgi:hypothetical protein
MSFVGFYRFGQLSAVITVKNVKTRNFRRAERVAGSRGIGRRGWNRPFVEIGHLASKRERLVLNACVQTHGASSVHKAVDGRGSQHEPVA